MQAFLNREADGAPGQSLLMYEALTDAGVPVELHMDAGQLHAFDIEPASARQRAAIMRPFLTPHVPALVAAS